mmetsp:Transcript_21507/g.61669  ORF Transcript_21507/g.61669 Transcript_21507/m.61669 type:complete len:227 (-) Transcript_21507:216-896(-)
MYTSHSSSLMSSISSRLISLPESSSSSEGEADEDDPDGVWMCSSAFSLSSSFFASVVSTTSLVFFCFLLSGLLESSPFVVFFGSFIFPPSTIILRIVSLLAPLAVNSANTSGSNLSPARPRILVSNRLARSALFFSNWIICCCSRMRSFSSSAPPSPDSASSLRFKCFGFLNFFLPPGVLPVAPLAFCLPPACVFDCLPPNFALPPNVPFPVLLACCLGLLLVVLP